VARRLLPFLFVLYVTNFVDRANLAYAGLGMSHDLGFSERVFGTGAGIFFVGYLSLQIPGALMAERWGARRLIGAIMMIWGGLTVLTGFVQTPLHLYAARFLLGAAEAARTLAEEKWIKTRRQSCSAWDALRYRPAILLGGVAFSAFSAGYAFYFWLPTMLKRFSGLSDLQVSLLGAVPFVAGLIGMQVNGWHSDLKCEQRRHISLPLFVEALAFLCLLALRPNLELMVALFSVVGAATCALLPCLWNFPTLL